MTGPFYCRKIAVHATRYMQPTNGNRLNKQTSCVLEYKLFVISAI